jgi:DNA-directed RNA polymerase subunit RPC12/RpoP
MPRTKQKTCPRCGKPMERIYNRQIVGEKRQYLPIGYICPSCCEDMIVLDIGSRKQDGYDGITCPSCESRRIIMANEKEEKLKCLSCKRIFELTPLPEGEVKKKLERVS